MKKICLILLCFVSLLLSGCRYPEKSNTVKVCDMVGDNVEIVKNPKKVACVSRTTYDLLVAFGLGDCIDGAYYTIYDNSWIELINPRSKNEYRYEYQESYETFISRGVDLVFAPEKYIADGLREHGINAITVSLYGKPTFDDYLFAFSNLVKTIWDDSSVHSKVDKWQNEVTKAINDVKSNNLNKKLYYVRGDKFKGIGYTDQKGSFTEFAYRTMGFDFVSSNFESNKPSKEEICNVNPDYIVIGGIFQNKLVKELENEPYCNLDCVKQNNVYTIPVALTMFEQLSVVTPIFFYDQANKLLGSNYDITNMVIDTFKDYFSVTLTKGNVENMLNGKDINGVDLA